MSHSRNGEPDIERFYMIPTALFSDKKYSGVSHSAKLLYALLLNRRSLSRKNGWIDKNNRVYIYFTIESAMELLGIRKDKCIKLFKELDSQTGCGLIEKKNQGQGRPAKIYVNDCDSKCGKSVENSSKPITENQETSKEPTFRGWQNRLLELHKADL